MPQVLKEDIRINIERAALHEFYEKGYKFATMKRIAERAGIPTGLIYSYFSNKEDLFKHIITPVCTSLEVIIAHQHRSLDITDNLFDNELPKIMESVIKYRTQLVILIDKSLGSPFAHIKAKLIEDVTLHLRHSPCLKDTRYDPIFYHILATNFMEGVFEIARHYVDQAWAERMLRLLVIQHLYGVSALAAETTIHRKDVHYE
ncbi:MAG: helix-turn-helix domain-containing protein [Candidatus Vecturithrix sp.]|jgi:AcrR family transcriptional regulator|nr:helix-turn-helix domain-containing protein [Candidatus Vecturithrix sp.]